jgi:mRNA interferase MazF
MAIFLTGKPRPGGRSGFTNPIGPHQHVILAFISSRIPSDLLDTDLVLDSEEDDFNTTGLRVSSTLRIRRLMTVTAGLIKRELGELSAQRLVQVEERVRKLFNLT